MHIRLIKMFISKIDIYQSDPVLGAISDGVNHRLVKLSIVQWKCIYVHLSRVFAKVPESKMEHIHLSSDLAAHAKP